MTEWRADVLGDEFECTDIDLGEDDEGPLVATLVRALPKRLGLWERTFGLDRALEHTDVLYVHGWGDYFFQKRLARYFTGQGARFYALDLRKYGRSLREGQTQSYVENLGDYDAEIAGAIGRMRAEAVSKRKLLLFGHSTGGLVLSLWADRHPGEADGLILNSPWLQLQLGGVLRTALTSVINLRARFHPQDQAFPQFDHGFYKEAQRRVADPADLEGVNLDWRPEMALPVRTGWLNAVLEGHAKVEAGLNIDAPACVLLSDRTHFGLTWSDDMLAADTVLEVEGIARASLKLGPSVTVERIRGALHDVFVSAPAARDLAFARMDHWVRGYAQSF